MWSISSIESPDSNVRPARIRVAANRTGPGNFAGRPIERARLAKVLEPGGRAICKSPETVIVGPDARWRGVVQQWSTFSPQHVVGGIDEPISVVVGRRELPFITDSHLEILHIAVDEQCAVIPNKGPVENRWRRSGRRRFDWWNGKGITLIDPIARHVIVAAGNVEIKIHRAGSRGEDDNGNQSKQARRMYL